MVINCMGKGKEGSQTYNLYIEVYTQLERGEKNNDQHRYGLRPFATGQLKRALRNNNIFEFDLRFNGEVTVEENSS